MNINFNHQLKSMTTLKPGDEFHMGNKLAVNRVSEEMSEVKDIFQALDGDDADQNPAPDAVKLSNVPNKNGQMYSGILTAGQDLVSCEHTEGAMDGARYKAALVMFDAKLSQFFNQIKDLRFPN